MKHTSMTELENPNQKLKWSELPEGFQKLLRRSYGEYKEILYDPCLHPAARKIPSWVEWLDKHDIDEDVISSESN
ncbi:MAG: hypothetical protein RIG62_31145 [Cyclobacteriaceae bacterium]